jgi:hypothetical protein
MRASRTIVPSEGGSWVAGPSTRGPAHDSPRLSAARRRLRNPGSDERVERNIAVRNIVKISIALRMEPSDVSRKAAL